MSEVRDPAARSQGRAVRAFFAWELPAGAKAELGALARELRARPDGDAVRWVLRHSYHVTLRFLGNVETAVLPGLVAAVEAELRTVKPLAVVLGAPHAFPSAERPRVVVVGLEPEAALAALAERVEAGVVAAGLPAERRRFRAHLTLGRVRSRRLPALDVKPLAAGALGVHEVVLFRSDLDRDGSRYTPLAQLPLPTSIQ
jgi:2'-5' RNA ligase